MPIFFSTFLSTLLAQGGLENPIVEGTFLDTKYLNPDYLFDKQISVYNYITNPTLLYGLSDLFHGILYFLTIHG